MQAIKLAQKRIASAMLLTDRGGLPACSIEFGDLTEAYSSCSDSTFKAQVLCHTQVSEIRCCDSAKRALAHPTSQRRVVRDFGKLAAETVTKALEKWSSFAV